MSKAKICLALLVWIILGFMIGVALIGFGFIAAMMFKVFSSWKILLFTVLGMVIVLAYIVEEIINEK